MISAVYKFSENILESSQDACETALKSNFWLRWWIVTYLMTATNLIDVDFYQLEPYGQRAGIYEPK